LKTFLNKIEMKIRKRLISLLFACSVVLVSCDTDEVNDPQIWFENIGSRTDLPFLPDGNVNYYGYFFSRNKGDKIGIRIKGKYGYARYMSYNVYDKVTRSSQASLVDTDIQPDAGNSNPYTALSQPDNRSYTIHILPDITEASIYGNALLYNDSLTDVGTLLRYYVPQFNNEAGVELPEVEAFDMLSGRKVPLPTPLSVSFDSFTGVLGSLSDVIGLTLLMQGPVEQYFYRFSGAGLFQNADNKYLFAPVSLENNKVIMFRFLPPGYAADLPGIPSADVRYYSLCIGDFKTYNYVTRADFELKIASDGYIYVVIARADPEVMTKATGLNFLSWPTALPKKGLIVYRNQLTAPDYAYPMTLVPDLVANIGSVLDPISLAAHTYMGDRAPLGIKMDRDDFLNDFGGFEVAY